MKSSVITLVRRIAAIAVIAADPVAAAAGPLCESARPRASELTCRGGGGMTFASPADVDLTLVVRLSRERASTDVRTLAPATCRAATPIVEGGGPQRLIVPLGGPLASVPYPIGHQAAVCAREAACVMTVCVYVADGELRAVDGYLTVSFW
jgi:hypothetical protein